MSISTANVPGLGEVRIRKLRGVRSIRLRVDAHGTVHITLPWWVSKNAGLVFLKANHAWVEEQQRQHLFTVSHGIKIYDGTAVYVDKTDSQRVSTKASSDTIQLNIPKGWNEGSPEAQAKLKQMLTKVIKLRAEDILPKRLQQLAELNNFTYKTAKVRSLKARWGSCNESKDITLNIYLVQLPVQLIDYVLLHELTHTKHMHHGKDFWSELTRVCPEAKRLRKDLKRYQPRLYEQSEVLV